MVDIYTIQQGDGAYFHKDGKIILFESEGEVNEFLNCFAQYSVDRLSREGNMSKAVSAPIMIMSNSVVKPVDFDIDTVPCGVIYARDMRK